jgi:polyhydroxyalkanoate synthesis regulator protein
MANFTAKPKKRLVKRYARARLFDVTTAQYVSADQILTYVRAGDRVTILDADTQADITPECLSQSV